MIKNYIYKQKNKIDLSERVTVFTGANMIGKTRLLETISEADNFLAKKFWSSDKSQIFNSINKTFLNNFDKCIGKSITSLTEVDLSHFVTSKNIGYLFDSVRRSLANQLQSKDLDDLEIEFKEMNTGAIKSITISTIKSKIVTDEGNMRLNTSISFNGITNSSYEYPESLIKKGDDFKDTIKRTIRDSIFKKIIEMTSGTKLRESAIRPIFIKAQTPSNLDLEKFDNNKYIELFEKSERIVAINSLFKKMFKLEIKVTLKSFLFCVSGDEYNYEKLSSGYKKLGFLWYSLVTPLINDYFRFNKKELFVIFEEPENHLSLGNILNIAEMIKQLTKKINCNFIISTHSDFLVSALRKNDVRIYEFVPMKTKNKVEKIQEIDNHLPNEFNESIDKLLGL